MPFISAGKQYPISGGKRRRSGFIHTHFSGIWECTGTGLTFCMNSTGLTRHPWRWLNCWNKTGGLKTGIQLK